MQLEISSPAVININTAENVATIHILIHFSIDLFTLLVGELEVKKLKVTRNVIKRGDMAPREFACEAVFCKESVFSKVRI